MRLPRSPRRRRAVGVALGSLVLAACGTGGDDAADHAPVPATDTSVSAFGEILAASTPLDGSAFDAASLAGTDTVVWFWAPWCTSCRAEAPEVVEIAERYAGRVDVVGVPGRGNLDAMRDFVDDTNTGSLTHLADLDGSVWSAFGVYGQPAFAFIDDSGDIDVFVGGLGGDALAERIDELLAT